MSSRRFVALALVALVTATFAGCVEFTDTLDPQTAGTPPAAVSSYYPVELGDSVYRLNVSAGGLSVLQVEEGDGGEVRFGEPVLVFTNDGRLKPLAIVDGEGTEPIQVDRALRFIPPPGVDVVNVTIDGATSQFPVLSGDTFVSGEHVIELHEVQERDFPHRTPGHENYAKAQEYFVRYFEQFGYEVEVDPYGTMALDDARLPAGPTRGIGPSSVANVVAYKPGTADSEKYIVIGGHYDVVEETVHGAFDNTAGTMAVMELARAFANVTTEHTLVFALWGGEEDGILGSRFWVESNPDKVPHITTYLNMDVTGSAWPGPAPNPDPIMVSAGPDGTHTSNNGAMNLLAEARTVIDEWLLFKDARVEYEPMVEGQATGAGVNAQSDHTSFATTGVPSYFIFNGNVDMILGVIHSPADTLANMTAYMVTGKTPYDGELTAEEEAFGRSLLAKSYEAQMYIPFYYTLLKDAGEL